MLGDDRLESVINKLLTVRQAVKLFGVNECTIYRWIKRGELETIAHPGARRLIKVDARLIEALKQRYGTEGL